MTIFSALTELIRGRIRTKSDDFENKTSHTKYKKMSSAITPILLSLTESFKQENPY
jgi:hypothetical protein